MRFARLYCMKLLIRKHYTVFSGFNTCFDYHTMSQPKQWNSDLRNPARREQLQRNIALSIGFESGKCGFSFHSLI